MMNNHDHPDLQKAVELLQEDVHRLAVGHNERIARQEGHGIDFNQALTLIVESLEEMYITIRGVSDLTAMSGRMVRLGDIEAPMKVLIQKVLHRDMK